MHERERERVDADKNDGVCSFTSVYKEKKVGSQFVAGASVPVAGSFVGISQLVSVWSYTIQVSPFDMNEIFATDFIQVASSIFICFWIDNWINKMQPRRSENVKHKIALSKKDKNW